MYNKLINKINNAMKQFNSTTSKNKTLIDNAKKGVAKYTAELNSLKEEDPIQYFKQKMKYCMYNFEQYTLLMEFFEQKKKEVKMCKIEDIFKLEMINSINILEMIANIIIGYQEKLDLQFRMKKFDSAYDSIDLIVKDLERLWLVRNKYSHLNQTVNNLYKVKEFIKISKEYYQGGKDEAQN